MTGFSAFALQAAIGAAVKLAEQLGVAVNIAIVDAGGNLAAFLRMPGAFLASGEVAIDKAWTANSFGMSTTAFGEMLRGEAPEVREGLIHRPRILAFPGGQPVLRAGVLVGGIGVSGASAGQDDDIALSGRDALMEILSD